MQVRCTAGRRERHRSAWRGGWRRSPALTRVRHRSERAFSASAISAGFGSTTRPFTPSASTSRLSRGDPTISVPQATASITVAEATGIAWRVGKAAIRTRPCNVRTVCPSAVGSLTTKRYSIGIQAAERHLGDDPLPSVLFSLRASACTIQTGCDTASGW